MKQKVRFLLKNPNAVSSTAINMIYSWGYRDSKGDYKNMKYATQQSVDPNEWDKLKQKATGAYSGGINAELASIKAAADKLFIRLIDDDLTPVILKSELDIAIGRATIESVARIKIKKAYLRDYITKYIADIESGRRRTLRDPLKRMAPSTIITMRAFKTKVTDYEEKTGKKYSFDDIDMKFYIPFLAWLGEMHTINSAGKTIKQLKIIMQAALDDGIHSNVEFKRKSFRVTTELVDTIYLTDKEIEKLYNQELSGSLEKARDLFLIGCFTLQRISDWNKLNKSNIKTTPKGTKIFSFVQQKTGTKVAIPIIHPWLTALLEKYDFEPPKMSDAKVNEYIKEACKTAKLTKKADLVSSHTGRRSGCTNWYRAGIPISKIMKVSGHKTEFEFKKYIRVTDEENAEDLATHKYFSTPKEKVK